MTKRTQPSQSMKGMFRECAECGKHFDPCPRLEKAMVKMPKCPSFKQKTAEEKAAEAEIARIDAIVKRKREEREAREREEKKAQAAL